ncbi:glycosyltransferase [Microbacterium aerolatum]|uniref:glycosyltransferase n=1 Tax=Microbacterium aerolatum TaxID=153731 RepID=UPI00384DE91C
MRILHLVPLHIPASGIIQQAIAEQYAADQTSVDWQVRLFTDVDLPEAAERLRIHAGGDPGEQRRSSWIRYAADKLSHRRSLYRWIREHQHEYDAIILRYTTSDIARARALRRLSIPVVSLHHTLEVPEIKLLRGYQRLLQVVVESVVGPRNILAAAVIAGVTDEVVQHELARVRVTKPTMTFPNGIDLSKQPVAADERSDLPELLFVASTFATWHGLDLLLDDLHRTDADFRLHLVGDVDPADRERAIRDPRLVLHGRLTPDAIRDLTAQSWVGLSSFALERKGMEEACTLKVREYLASGLPTYAGHRDRFPTEASYYLQGPPVFDRVLEYAHRTRNLTRDDVRRQSAPFISKANILEEAHDRLDGILSVRR